MPILAKTALSPALASGDGKLYLGWTSSTNGVVALLWSQDDGKTWLPGSAPAVSFFGPGVAYGGGIVCIAWTAADGGVCVLTGLGQQRVVSSALTCAVSGPMMSGDDGAFLVAWQDGRSMTYYHEWLGGAFANGSLNGQPHGLLPWGERTHWAYGGKGVLYFADASGTSLRLSQVSSGLIGRSREVKLPAAVAGRLAMTCGPLTAAGAGNQVCVLWTDASGAMSMTTCQGESGNRMLAAVPSFRAIASIPGKAMSPPSVALMNGKMYVAYSDANNGGQLTLICQDQPNGGWSTRPPVQL